MSLFRLRFRIGSLLKATAICALVFALLRTPAAPFVEFFLAVLLGFFIDRTRGGTGVAGGALFGGLALFVVGLALCASVYYARDWRTFMVDEPALFLLWQLVVGTFFGAAISIGLCWIIKRVGRSDLAPVTEDTCGPIDWQGLVEDTEPPRAA